MKSTTLISLLTLSCCLPHSAFAQSAAPTAAQAPTETKNTTRALPPATGPSPHGPGGPTAAPHPGTDAAPSSPHGPGGPIPPGAASPHGPGGPIPSDAASPHGPGGAVPSGAASPHSGPMQAGPHTMNGAMAGPKNNISRLDPQLPQGTVEVQVLGHDGQPVQDAQVELVTIFQSIAEGNSDSSVKKSPGAQGLVRFSSLDNALRFSYAVKVTRGGAHYEIPPFRLKSVGQRVVIYTYPVATDINDAFVGMRGFAYVQLREGFYRVDLMYRIMNMSEKTWLPKNLLLDLPKNATAIDVTAKDGDAGFLDKNGSVELTGSYPPGQKDIRFSFQLPNENTSTLNFEMGVPPHLAELRVLSEVTPGMSLDVPGFEVAEPATGPEGQKVLITRRVMQPGQSELKRVQIELGNLPVIGPGRWIAVLLGSVIALGGLFGGFFRRSKSDNEVEEERQLARQLLLDEMKLLEEAKSQDKIGPRTYEQTKRQILLALARLEEKTAA